MRKRTEAEKYYARELIPWNSEGVVTHRSSQFIGPKTKKVAAIEQSRERVAQRRAMRRAIEENNEYVREMTGIGPVQSGGKPKRVATPAQLRALAKARSVRAHNLAVQRSYSSY